MARYATITVRRDSSLNWEAANPRLALGEIGVDMTLLRFKVGNGIDRWNQLPYMNDDLYSDLDRDMREVTDRINAILETIRTNKRDADNKIGSVDSRLTVLETRQSAYERGLTAQFEEAEQALQDGLNDFAETKENLTIRMDIIAGSATEDTEILDARVDANYDTHPNLGHNIRSIHSELINQGLQLSEEIQEAAKQAHDELVESAEELQQQINDNSEANLYNATNLHDEAEQRREDNQRLKLQDEFLQSEVDELNEGLQAEISQRSDADTARQDEIKTLNRALEDEAYERQNTAAGLARQANENAEANLQNTLDILVVAQNDFLS